MSYADAVTREAAWFTAAVAGLPDLGAPTGPLDLVVAYPRRISQRSRQLWLYRAGVTDDRLGLAGERLWRHQMVAYIVWGRALPSSEAHIDAANLDAAIDSVLARIRGGAVGTVGDPSHGARWLDQVGPIRCEYLNPLTPAAPVDAAGSAGNAFEVRISYVVTEAFVG